MGSWSSQSERSKLPPGATLGSRVLLASPPEPVTSPAPAIPEEPVLPPRLLVPGVAKRLSQPPAASNTVESDTTRVLIFVTSERLLSSSVARRRRTDQPRSRRKLSLVQRALARRGEGA